MIFRLPAVTILLVHEFIRGPIPNHWQVSIYVVHVHIFMAILVFTSKVFVSLVLRRSISVALMDMVG